MSFNLAEMNRLGNRFFDPKVNFLPQTQITLLEGEVESR